MMEQVKEFATRLKPPGRDATPEDVQSWRWFVALTTGITAMGMTAHIIIACGYATGLGLSGFAKATEIPIVVAEAMAKKREQELPSMILDAKQKQCNATGEAKRLYLKSYNELRTEYFGLTKREFPDPPCTDFM
jgi:hypothetical protein